MNLTAYRTRKGYGQRKHWSRNAAAAKARLRVERDQAAAAIDPDWKAPKLPKLKFALVTIRCGLEYRSFRVHRWDAKSLLALGKVQAASTIGKRIALALEAIL